MVVEVMTLNQYECEGVVTLDDGRTCDWYVVCGEIIIPDMEQPDGTKTDRYLAAEKEIQKEINSLDVPEPLDIRWGNRV